MADRDAGRRKFAVGVIAQGAFIGAAEQAAVGPFKVEHQPQGFAHLGLTEGRAPGVHEQALALGRDLVGDLRLDHVAAVDRREVVAIRPVLGLVLDIDISSPALKASKATSLSR